MRIAVGVDGGGTRATAVVSDESGRELARCQGQAGIVEADRIEEVVQRLLTLAGAALTEASCSGPCDVLVCALAGAGREPQRGRVEQGLRDAGIALRVGIVTDAEAAFHDAFGDRAGVLLIAGTGSIAWGRDTEGRSARAGGWGARLGDEGSSYAIAIAGLRAVVRAADGRDPPTALTDALLLEPGIQDPSALVRWAEAARKKDIASLAPTVLRLAEKDAVASRIADQAVTELALHVEAVTDRLGPWPGGPAVALAGGLLDPGRALRERVRHAILARVPTARIRDEAVDGARGAAALARLRLD